MLNLEEAFQGLDKFVFDDKFRDGGGYVGNVPQGKNPDYVIQQVRKEIYEFSKIILEKTKRKRILEIGLGNHGGTRFLWQMLFEKVITIESDPSKIANLSYDTIKEDIICGSSHDRNVYYLAAEHQPYDVFFIDGDHSYNGIAVDHDIYRTLVRRNGITAIHDSFQKGYGTFDFVNNLRNDYNVKDILDNDVIVPIGISYYFHKYRLIGKTFDVPLL